MKKLWETAATSLPHPCPNGTMLGPAGRGEVVPNAAREIKRTPPRTRDPWHQEADGERQSYLVMNPRPQGLRMPLPGYEPATSCVKCPTADRVTTVAGANGTGRSESGGELALRGESRATLCSKAGYRLRESTDDSAR